MDNLFEYVIVLFFIFSLLQSLLSKKKKQQNSEAEAGQENPDVQRKQRRNTQTLEDLFGINLPKTPDYDTGYAKTPASENVTWDPASEFREVSGTKPKPVPDVDFDKPQSKSFIDKKRVEMAAAFENKVDGTLTATENIRLKLKDARTVREIVLISEILNKPRALRK